MSAKYQDTAELLRRYLNGAITAPEEAELERRAQTDEVLAEALLGLRAMPEADHTARVAWMRMGARRQVVTKPAERVQGKDKKNRPESFRRVFYAAAAMVALLVIAVFLLPQFTSSSAGDLAMEMEPTTTENSTPVPPTKDLEDDTPGTDQVSEPAPTVASPDAAGTTAPSPIAVKKEALPPRPRPTSPAVVTGELLEEEVPAEEITTAGAPLPPAPLPTPTVSQPELADNGLEEEAAEAYAEAERKVNERRRQSAAFREEMAAANDGKKARLVIGRITNENGAPIENALIRQPGLPLGQRTDTNGIFRLEVDAVASILEISHPKYDEEKINLKNFTEDLQIVLERENGEDRTEWSEAWSVSRVPINTGPGYALPEEGYNALRKRIEENKPADLPTGKVKLSFLVDPDGTLSDFVFRGKPDQATMDYVGETIMQTSIWNVVNGEEPVRVYFKVVFKE
ncbi:MAG: hypothetical protein AAGF89_00450 [Bacteroidota bacterium]